MNLVFGTVCLTCFWVECSGHVQQGARICFRSPGGTLEAPPPGLPPPTSRLGWGWSEQEALGRHAATTARAGAQRAGEHAVTGGSSYTLLFLPYDSKIATRPSQNLKVILKCNLNAFNSRAFHMLQSCIFRFLKQYTLFKYL